VAIAQENRQNKTIAGFLKFPVLMDRQEAQDFESFSEKEGELPACAYRISIKMKFFRKAAKNKKLKAEKTCA